MRPPRPLRLLAAIAVIALAVTVVRVAATGEAIGVSVSGNDVEICINWGDGTAVRVDIEIYDDMDNLVDAWTVDYPTSSVSTTLPDGTYTVYAYFYDSEMNIIATDEETFTVSSGGGGGGGVSFSFDLQALLEQLQALIAMIASIPKKLQELADAFYQALQATFAIITAPFRAMWDFLSNLGKQVHDAIVGGVKWIQDTLGQIPKMVYDGIKWVGDSISAGIKAICDGINNVAQSVWGAITGFFSAVMSGVQKFVESVSSAVQEIWQSLQGIGQGAASWTIDVGGQQVPVIAILLVVAGLALSLCPFGIFTRLAGVGMLIIGLGFIAPPALTALAGSISALAESFKELISAFINPQLVGYILLLVGALALLVILRWSRR